MTVREMLARIDSHELTEWRVFYGLNPWGPERADLRAGTVASVIANCHSTDRTFKPSDFMPDFSEPEPEPQSDEDIRDMAIRINAMLGGESR